MITTLNTKSKMSTMKRSSPAHGTRCVAFVSPRSIDLGQNLDNCCFSPMVREKPTDSQIHLPARNYLFCGQMIFQVIMTLYTMLTMKKSFLSYGTKSAMFLSMRTIDLGHQIENPCSSEVVGKRLILGSVSQARLCSRGEVFL